MKRFTKTLGVTLLEVMLVLAIAAMIIVMSIRYYQSASASQQSNSFLSQVQGIVAAAEQLAQGTGSFQNINGSSLSTSNLGPLLPGGAFMAPWGTPIVIANVQPNSFQMTLASIPSGVCPLVRSKLATNNHFSSSGSAAATLTACPAGSGAWNFYYVSNP